MAYSEFFHYTSSHGSFSRCLDEQPSLPGATAGSGVQASDFVTVQLERSALGGKCVVCGLHPPSRDISSSEKLSNLGTAPTQ